MNTPHLSLVIPAYNEEAALESTVRALVKAFDGVQLAYELVIVDNGSIDTTELVAKRLSTEYPQIRVVRLQKNQGKGGGVLEGLRVCRGSVLGWTDSDGQVDPDSVVAVFRSLQPGVAMAVPSRDSRGGNSMRVIQSFIYNRLFRLLFGVPFSDINAPPKFLSRVAYEKIRPVQKDWFLDAECIIKLMRRGERIVETNIHWIEREDGASKIRIWTSVEFLKNMLLYRLYLK